MSSRPGRISGLSGSMSYENMLQILRYFAGFCATMIPFCVRAVVRKYKIYIARKIVPLTVVSSA